MRSKDGGAGMPWGRTLFRPYRPDEEDVMQTRSWVPAALAVLALAGCQTWGPAWTELSGTQYNRTDYNRFATLIENVDGKNPGPQHGGSRNYGYYKVEPGRHTIELQALNTTPNWVPGVNLENLSIDLEPCKRYYLNAQFDNRLLGAWKPVVDYVEPIAGCNAAAR
jgi:hypothetical protein